MKKICCLFNYAPHYRSSIYQLMDRELHCDFYFGSTVFMPLKKMDYSNLKGYKSELRPIRIGRFRWYMGIRKVFFKNYDSYIITGDMYNFSIWCLLLYCIITKKKLYMWGHGLKQAQTKKGEFLSKLYFGNVTGGMLLYSDYSRQFMIKAGYRADRIFLIYNSLNYNEQLELRNKLSPSDIYKEHFENDDPVLFFIGRLTPEKKLNLLIQAQKRLHHKGVLSNVVIVGSGESENILRDLVEENSLEKRVWLYGSCYDEERISTMIYNADLTISPGSIGLTAIHSLMFGTPIITHANFEIQGPEFEAISKGATGDFFLENDLDDLVLKIKEWIMNQKKRRNSVRRQCYQRIDAYYNPGYQINAIKSILYANPLDHK